MTENITLVHPADDAVVDGLDVTLQWTAVDQAEAYLIQVANDLDFTEIVHEQSTTDASPVHLTGRFGDSGEVFFWRVIAQRAGQSVVSDASCFIAESRDSIPELAPEVNPAHIEAGVEPEDVDVRPIFAAVAFMFVFLVIAVNIVFNWMNLEVQEATAAAITEDVNPVVRDAVTEAEKNLTQYGRSAANGSFRIPVDAAIEIIANETQQGQPGNYTNQLRLQR